MDIDKKGFISVEDLVRFINVESDTYYRNRDLVLIYKRLLFKNEEQVTLESMKKVFCL